MAHVEGDGSTGISSIPRDIILTHVFSRLDGPSLASAACTSSELHSITCDENHWFNLCRSTWPSTDTPRLHQVISTFPHGSRSFFCESFPLFLSASDSVIDRGVHTNTHIDGAGAAELLSAVDLHYQGKPVFSKVIETTTTTGWFRFAPFLIDLLDPKQVVQTPIEYPNADSLCTELAEYLKLSWIVIDPKGRRAINLSSQKPVSVQRHWLSGEVDAGFAYILAGEKGTSSEFVQSMIAVKCSGLHGKKMQVTEMSLHMEDMDGKHLSGKDSLVILQRAWEGKKGNSSRREEEGSKRYEEFLKMKSNRRERKLRREGALDRICMASAILLFAGLVMFLFR